jgi:radical SAM protein with 4Fe4S-binding SPASM domain
MHARESYNGNNSMKAWNRWRLLRAYLARRTRLDGLPVEYIVETTAKCNLYCPMCPREIYRQPKEDMTDEIFERLVAEAAPAAEHMMLIGLGEPLLDRKIFDRIEYCARHGISTLLSTNGTLLDEAAAARLLDSPLEHITLSFDGATRETFEYYRKGARFEQVRDNFVRFCRMKHERRARVQIVVQMVRLERNEAEIGDFLRFWTAVPGVDVVRIKEDETRLLRPGAGHPPGHWKYPCHYLWRGPVYVKHNGDVYPCCQSYALGGRPLGRIGEHPIGELWNAPEIVRMRELHAAGRGGEVEICSRCTTTIPHPALVVGSLILHGRWVRRLLPRVERLARRWLKPPVQLAPAPEQTPAGKAS